MSNQLDTKALIERMVNKDYKVAKNSVADLIDATLVVINKEGGRVFESLQLKDDNIDLNNIDWTRTNLEGLGIKMEGVYASMMKKILNEMPSSEYKANLIKKLQTEEGIVETIATIKHNDKVKVAALKQTPWAFEWFLKDDRKNNEKNRDIICLALDQHGYNLQHVLPDEKENTPCGIEDEALLDRAIKSNPYIYETFVLRTYMQELAKIESNLDENNLYKLPVHSDEWREMIYGYVCNKKWLKSCILRDYRSAWYLPDELRNTKEVLAWYNLGRGHRKPATEIRAVKIYASGDAEKTEDESLSID